MLELCLNFLDMIKVIYLNLLINQMSINYKKEWYLI